MTARSVLLGLALAAAGCATSIDLPIAPGDDPAGRPELGPPPVGTNAPPVVQIDTPIDGATVGVGAPIDLSASFTDPDVTDTHTCYVDWLIAAAGGTLTETAGAGRCTGSFAYPSPGVYPIVVAVIDNLGNTAMDTISVTVTAAPPPPVPPTSPNAGSVLGDGMLNLSRSMVAQASRRPPALWFVIVATVDPRTNKARGAVEIVVPNVDLKLRSASLERIRVDNSQAEIRGVGTIGKTAGYRFLISVLDEPRRGREWRDKVRIKIWNGSGVLVDTDPGAPDDAQPAQRLDRGEVLIRP